MFIEELIENSKISPTIFSDCSAYDVYLSNIWISFEQFELSAKNELNILYNILLDSSDIYFMNIDTDFMLLDPFQFEVFIANLFEKKGYTCIVTSKTGDYGIDVIAKKDNEIIGIQAKKIFYGK